MLAMDHHVEPTPSAPSTSTATRNVLGAPKRSSDFALLPKESHSTPKQSPFMKAVSRRILSATESTEFAGMMDDVSIN